MQTKSQGFIKTWKADKGFGFIAPTGGGDDLFFHISQVTHSKGRLAEGMRVSYVAAYDAQRRLQATQIDPKSTASLDAVVISIIAVMVFAGLLIGAVVIIPLSPLILVPYLLFSVWALLAYRDDKARAQHGARRTPENTLHTLEFLGGWPGALIAQALYHHKSAKQSYQLTYWLIVALHLVVLVGYAWISLG